MADNVVITAGTGTTVHADEYTHTTLGSGKTQLVKLVDGTLDAEAAIAADIGAKANALRVAPANDITDATYIGDIKFGESLPAGTNAIGKLAANSGVDIGDVDILSIAAGDNNIGNVDIVTVPAPLNVVGGGTEAAALRVTIANNSTGVLSIDDGGNTITVDGTITANLSATDNAVLDVIAGDTTSLDGKITACNTGAVVLSSGTVTTVSTVTNLAQMGGAALNMGEGTISTGTQRVTIATDDDGVAHLATIAGDTTSIDGKITACNTGAVVLSSGTVTTVSTVTNLSQLGGTAVSMNEGTIDAGCQRVTIATDDDGVAHLATIAGDTTNIETAIQIIDDWDAVHDSAASSDGPQIMAAYDSTKPTAVGDGDAVRLLADSYGRLLPGVEPQFWSATINSADASSATQIKAAGGASTRHYITSIIISCGAAMNVTIQDDAGTPNIAMENMYFAANGGLALPFPPQTPIQMGADNQDIDVIASTSGNITVTLTGYTI